MIVAGVDLDRKYSIEEITEMYLSGRYRGIVFEGYVTQANADGTIGFVPWHESTLARVEAKKTVKAELDLDAMAADVEREHPIVRRTPQERLAAVALRILGEVKRSGGHGLSPSEVNAITGESWAVGEPVTGEQVQALAGHFLNRGEHTNKDADSRRVTRAHKTA